jgi:phosphomannomutase
MQNDCDIVLANDTDADRLGVSEFSKEIGEWTVFTVDQIGALLGHWLWEKIG